MKRRIALGLALMITQLVFGQTTDTLTFYSQALQETRSVYVHTPVFYKYKSDSLRLPVIIILDGQNEWFVNPLLNQIEYLQYTHEIPNALVIVIPHKNRNKECGIINISEKQPLDVFITHELDNQIQKYDPGEYKIIIGHSFSASFALYSYLHNSKYYSAVIANSPVDQLEKLVDAFVNNQNIQKSNIFISVGGIARDKDFYHRTVYDKLKSSYPDFFASINTFEADNSSHNAVPIVTDPTFFTKLFSQFSGRFSDIAKVDQEYKLIDKPKSTEEEILKIKNASKLGTYFYPPEIADLNGIASRFSYSGYDNYALRIYEEGLKYYSFYYGFYLSEYDLLKNSDKQKSKLCLKKAKHLIEIIENNSKSSQEMIKYINSEMKKNGWQ